MTEGGNTNYCSETISLKIGVIRPARGSKIFKNCTRYSFYQYRGSSALVARQKRSTKNTCNFVEELFQSHVGSYFGGHFLFFRQLAKAVNDE